VPLLLLFAWLLREVAGGLGGGNLFTWTIRAVILIVLIRVGLVLAISVLTRERRTPARQPPPPRASLDPPKPGPGTQARERP
jgi:hypothetical protein